MTEHMIMMMATTDYDRTNYGKTWKSANVYRFARSSAPTRINVWDNTRRVNQRNGEPVRWGNFGPIDGGNGQYLDPDNKATDDAVSILITPESSVITNNGTNTGTVASGQVYAQQTSPIQDGDKLTLVYPDGSDETRIVKMTNNGHGRAL